MTVRLLVKYGKYSPGMNITLPTEQETRLLTTGRADTNTAIGYGYTAVPPDKYADPVSLVVSATGQSLRADNGPLIGLAQSTAFPKWRAAVSKVRNGDANAKLVLFGDSTSAGLFALGSGFAAGGRPYCPGVKLATRLRAAGLTAYASGMWGNPGVLTNAQLAAWDVRFTSAPTWNLSTAAVGGSWLRPFISSTASQTIPFTPAEQVDTFVIWYITASGSRIFSYAVDGGSATNVDGNNAAGIMASVTVAAGSTASHALLITKGSGLGNSIYGVEAYNSAIKSVEVIPWGISGARAKDGLANTSAGNDSLTFLQTMAPHMTIVNLTINEWVQGGSFEAYRDSISRVIAAAQVSGDVIVMSGVPTQDSITYPLSVQRQYVETVSQMAHAAGAYFYDSFSLFGSREADTSIYGDSIHPNGDGYEIMYSQLTALLVQ